MSTILRASGADFDVDAFLSTCQLEPIHVWRKGEPRFPASQPNGPTNSSSGANFEVSAANAALFSTQLEDAGAFFAQHADFVRRLRVFPSVQSVVVDFAVAIQPPGWTTFTLPSDLIAMIGALGVSVALSTYPRNGEAKPKAI